MPTRLEARGGIRTRLVTGKHDVEGSGWCDEPFHPERYTAGVLARALGAAR